MFFKDLYYCSKCGTAVSGKKTSYFICPNCKTLLCRKEKLEELGSHYCHKCGYQLDEVKEKALKYKNMSTAEAIEKSGPHFAKLVPSKKPKRMCGIANRGHTLKALQQLLWTITDTKKKFRLIIDYDSDFPIFMASLFDLNPINPEQKKEDSKIGS